MTETLPPGKFVRREADGAMTSWLSKDYTLKRLGYQLALLEKEYIEVTRRQLQIQNQRDRTIGMLSQVLYNTVPASEDEETNKSEQDDSDTSEQKDGDKKDIIDDSKQPKKRKLE